MTWPKKNLPNYIPTYLPTYLCTFIREHPKGAFLETCGLLDIWSDWWGDMTWPKKLLCRNFENFFDNFDNCWQIWQFLKKSCRLVTIETLIKILTIENLNSLQSLLPDNQEWHWTAFAILAMFLVKSFLLILIKCLTGHKSLGSLL